MPEKSKEAGLLKFNAKIENNESFPLLVDPFVSSSMDGKGRAIDNVMIERLWRTIKYEEVYLEAYANGADCKQSLKLYLHYYDYERRHQSLAHKTPWDVYYPSGAKRSRASIQQIADGGPINGVHFRVVAVTKCYTSDSG